MKNRQYNESTKNSIHCYNEQIDEKDDTYIKAISKLSQVANYKFREAFMCTVQNTLMTLMKVIW